MSRSLLLLLAVSAYAQPQPVTIAGDGSGDFASVQAAMDATPPAGSVIRIKPGTYREVLTIAKPGIQLRTPEP